MKILIPVDGSEASLNTIKAAAGFLDKEMSHIYLLIIEVPIAVEVTCAFIENQDAMVSILDKAALEAKSAGFTVERAEHTTCYSASQAICLYADKIKADLIVMGSHGEQGLTRFLMGSVSEKVFKEANQPVIVIRNDKSHAMEISHFEKVGLQQMKH